ncbi:MAG: IclR family transcriptional regulator [Burkholderiales bacterium]|nr:IclR family transcriptional regulator [Burkholderiales bacterium]
MRVLAASKEGVGVREIARAISVSPAIAQRLISSLAKSGFAEQESSRRYRVGLGAFAVGNAFLSSNMLARESYAELQTLADRHQLNSYLGVLRGNAIAYLATFQSSGPIAIKSSPGTQAHLHSTALGKVILAQLPEETARELLGAQPYLRLTARTTTRFSMLRTELAGAREKGYALCDEENLVGVFAIGAPVRDASGATVAAISGALARHELDRAKLPSLCRLVRDAAERISLRLGAPPSPDSTPRRPTNASRNRRS